MKNNKRYLSLLLSPVCVLFSICILYSMDLRGAHSSFLSVGIKLIKVDKNKPNANAISLEYKVTTEDANTMRIEPSGKYYDKYVSPYRFLLPQIGYTDTEYYIYPTIEFYVVNNTNRSININSLEIDVDHSVVDFMPYVYMATTALDCNSLTLVNNSCFNWETATLNYSILRKGEKFNGKYEKIRTIPYFDDEMVLDLTNDLVEKGYDFPLVKKHIENTKKNHKCYNYIVTDENYNTASKIFAPFELLATDFRGEYYPIAKLYGKLVFPYYNKSVEFQANVVLASDVGFGAVSWIDDKYNVKLNVNGNNYVKRYPYKTTIRPGDAERVRLIIGCDKSSNHKFRIRLLNYEGIDLHSKDVILHLINHKHCTIVTDDSLEL